MVIVSIGGSWCPNCHDEAPLLGDLYRKYKSQGLEIVETLVPPEPTSPRPPVENGHNKNGHTK